MEWYLTVIWNWLSELNFMKSADYTGIEWILNNIWPRRFLSSQLETKRKKKWKENPY